LAYQSSDLRLSQATALGAAFLAGLAVGFWPFSDTLAAHWHTDCVFEPRISSVEWAALR
jgi:glycerol kinase